MAKQRQVRIEQGLPQNLMEDMQDRTDEQLESETKHRSIALALLGARAAERYDPAAARTYFQRAIAASRPQERMQIRRMADASLALAERRPDDLKHAVEKLGQAPPSNRALMGLRLMGLIVPPPGGSVLLRLRGFAILALIVVALLGAGLGVVEVIAALFFGGVGLAPGILLGLIVVGLALALLAFVGRRKQKALRAGAKRPGAAKASPAGKGSAASAGKGSAASTTNSSAAARRGDRRGSGTAKPAGQAKASPPTKGAGTGTDRRGSGSASGTARAAAAAKGAPPAKPAKGAAPAKGAKGPSRPKRPSR